MSQDAILLAGWEMDRDVEKSASGLTHLLQKENEQTCSLKLSDSFNACWIWQGVRFCEQFRASPDQTQPVTKDRLSKIWRRL